MVRWLVGSRLAQRLHSMNPGRIFVPWIFYDSTMRNLAIPFLALFFVMFTCQLFAQPANVDPEEYNKLKEESELQMHELFELAEYRDYRKFAGMFLYTGRNQQRAWKGMMDYADPYESVEVENELNRIRHWMGKADGYEFSGFRIVQGLNQDLYVWDVEFKKKEKIKKHKIFLTQHRGRYVFYRSE